MNDKIIQSSFKTSLNMFYKRSKHNAKNNSVETFTEADGI